MKIEEFTADGVRAHVGSMFHVTLEDGRVFDLMLEEVKVVVEQHTSPLRKRDSFSLYFVGPESVYMPQGTYAVSHDELGGPWHIFIVPVGKREGTFLYEAVFA
jgi:hypothetical protein